MGQSILRHIAAAMLDMQASATIHPVTELRSESQLYGLLAALHMLGASCCLAGWHTLMLLTLKRQNQPASAPLLASLCTVPSQGSAAMVCSPDVLCLGPRASAFTSCGQHAACITEEKRQVQQVITRAAPLLRLHFLPASPGACAGSPYSL